MTGARSQAGRQPDDRTDREVLVALAGNPNTGKSTVFNNLTGLRQHTGNWPGKTVTRAEGTFRRDGRRFRVVDLPGTYSLLSESHDEEIARDFVLFSRPDVTVVVVDATRLERNLNLVLQILEITGRVVVCLNLMDEAGRKGISVEPEELARQLGVPVVPTSARRREGMEELVAAIKGVAEGDDVPPPRRLWEPPGQVKEATDRIAALLQTAHPGLPNAPWAALRLLEGDQRLREAVASGEMAVLAGGEESPGGEIARAALEEADRAGQGLPPDYNDEIVAALYDEAARIAGTAARHSRLGREDLDARIDRILTSRRWGLPVMLALLALVLWITVTGANYPSAVLASVLLDWGHPTLRALMVEAGAPWWLTGPLVDGAYLALAWVVAVMLPPMAIFFPLFTLLEDFGYLPRVAFNLDCWFRKAGAHGKQALTMCMGFGCNAAGVVAARVIDSPRERLIAMVTNNFALCNGRWPTQILLATIFVGALVPVQLAGLAAAATVVGVAGLGILMTFGVSWLLSRTLLRGEPSAFSLELPPYRPPRVLQTLYTSLIDRTLFVLWRAMVFAAPAGLVIWLVANLRMGGGTLAEYAIGWLDPVGVLMGLNGVILLAYVVAIPANEIVVPTVLMLTVLTSSVTGVGEGAGVMFELESSAATASVLHTGGWTLMTAVCVMLFSLAHNPCSTTLYTIWKETGSLRWTVVSALLPLAVGIAVCAATALVWRAAL